MTWLGHILRMHKELGEERLVKIAAKVQFDMTRNGNLFMDAPACQTFEEVVEMAQDRAAWRRLVDAKFGTRPRRRRVRKRTKKALTAPTHHPQTRVVKTPLLSILPSTSNKCTDRMTQPQLPAAWQPKALRPTSEPSAKAALKALCTKKPSSAPKKKSGRLTDAQRAAWAYAHFIINHGSNADAAKFLTHQKNVDNTPDEVLHKIRVMARRQVPTWEQAAAAVFSSSDSSSNESIGSTVQIHTLHQMKSMTRIIARRQVPTREQTAAADFNCSKSSRSKDGDLRRLGFTTISAKERKRRLDEQWERLQAEARELKKREKRERQEYSKKVGEEIRKARRENKRRKAKAERWTAKAVAACILCTRSGKEDTGNRACATLAPFCKRAIRHAGRRDGDRTGSTARLSGQPCSAAA